MLSIVPAAGPAKRNRHPVDELAEVRTTIKRLQEREAELREELLAGKCGLIGFDHQALVRETQTERIDTKLLREKLSPEQLGPFLKTSTTTVIKVTEREAPEDGA